MLVEHEGTLHGSHKVITGDFIKILLHIYDKHKYLAGGVVLIKPKDKLGTLIPVLL